MKTLDLSHPHRRAHFDHFRALANPHFGITANVDVTDFLEHLRQSAGWRFTPCVVYLITRAALSVAAFTYRIRGEEVVIHDNLRPSYAVPTRHAGVFSFCTVPFRKDPSEFHLAATETEKRMFDAPSFSDEPGADDYLFLSAFPWVSFTSVQHAMPAGDRSDSVPRIAWGKYFRQGDRILLPLAVQAHHAVVDGSDLGAFYREIENLLKKTEKIFTDQTGRLP